MMRGILLLAALASAFCACGERVVELSFFDLIAPHDAVRNGRLVRGHLAENPEWFAKDVGGRLDGRDDKVRATQLCPWNGGLRIELTRKILDRCAELKRGALAIGPEAVPGRICDCKGCLEMEKEFSSPAGSLFEYFAREVGPLAGELYPDVRLVLRLTDPTQAPTLPKGLTFPGNVRIELAKTAASVCEKRAVVQSTDASAPTASGAPRFNYPRIFGVRPGSPVVFRLPVCGMRPMTFVAKGLPSGVELDAATGVLSGSTLAAGTNLIEFTVSNAKGRCVQSFRLVVGDTFVLTPPLGFNTFGGLGAGSRLTDANVRKSVDALLASGLTDHGYSYCNIDDGWQGERGGPHHALQSNERFPDMKALGDYIHARGLKFGLYSTPYQRSYAKYHGGSSFYKDRSSPLYALRYKTIAPCLHDANDAEQVAEWGCDYFKYDWEMAEKELGVDTAHRWKSVEVAERMSRFLRMVKRDITFELSCFVDEDIPERFSAAGSMTRRTGDLMDVWYTKQCPSGHQNMGLRELWLRQRDPWWRVLNRPGHWNMPCPLRVGMLGGWQGPEHPMHPTRLTRDEQYSHISLWCLWSSPMIIGAPVDKLDDFTLGLLSNDELLALNQDPLGVQAEEFAVKGGEMLVKLLEDGDVAIGLFNVSDEPAEGEVTFDWRTAGLTGAHPVRDLWGHADLGVRDDSFTVRIPAHGCKVYRVGMK